MTGRPEIGIVNMNAWADACPICGFKNELRCNYCPECGLLMSDVKCDVFSMLQDQSGFCGPCDPEGCYTCRSSPVKTETKIVYVPRTDQNTRPLPGSKTLEKVNKKQKSSHSVFSECGRCIRVLVKLMIITAIINIFLGVIYFIFLIHGG
jgi:hypothetical protein